MMETDAMIFVDDRNSSSNCCVIHLQRSTEPQNVLCNQSLYFGELHLSLASNYSRKHRKLLLKGKTLIKDNKPPEAAHRLVAREKQLRRLQKRRQSRWCDPI